MKPAYTDDSTDESDEVLVLRVQQRGDQLAFDELYFRYYDRIHRFIAGLLGYSNQDRVDDLTQDTFRKATEKFSELRKTSSFGTWLHQIARNTVRDFWRQGPRRGREQPFTPDAQDTLEDCNSQVEESVIARNRSSINFVVHLLAGLIACSHQDKKPGLHLDELALLAA